MNGSPTQMNWTRKLPPYESFHNRLRIYNPLEKDCLVYEKLISSGFTTQSALVKMRLSEIPPTGAANYSYLQNVWEHEKMQSFKDFFALLQ